MWPLGTVDALILVPVTALAIAAIIFASNRLLRVTSVIARLLRVTSVIALIAVAFGYTVFRPSARAALAYHKSSGGVWSKEWLEGVESMLAVSRHLPVVVLVAALLLGIVALRSK